MMETLVLASLSGMSGQEVQMKGFGILVVFLPIFIIYQCQITSETLVLYGKFASRS